MAMKTSNLLFDLSKRWVQQQPTKASIQSALLRVVNYLIIKLTEGNELQIWQTSDRCGNNWWHAYDPVTNRHTVVDSEAHLRAWIEQRYYH